MWRKVICLLVLFCPPLVFAGQITLSVKNGSLTNLQLAITKDSVSCMQVPGIFQANGQRVLHNDTGEWQVMDDVQSNACSDGAKSFKLNLKDVDSGDLVGDIQYTRLPSQQWCDSGVISTAVADAKNYLITKQCEQDGDKVQVKIEITHPYTPLILVGVRNAMLFPEDKTYPLMLKDYSPLNPSYYDPGYPSEVDPSAPNNSASFAMPGAIKTVSPQISSTKSLESLITQPWPCEQGNCFYPISSAGMSPSTAVTYYVAGFPSVNCQFRINWSVKGCTAEILEGDGEQLKNFNCLNIGPRDWLDSKNMPSEEIPPGLCLIMLAYGASGLTNEPFIYNVSLNNEIDQTLSLRQLSPANNPRHQYQPEPPAALEPQTQPFNFEVTVPWDPAKAMLDSGFTHIAYGPEDNAEFYCQLTFNWSGVKWIQDKDNPEAVCAKAQVVGADSEPVRKLICHATYTIAPVVPGGICRGIKWTIGLEKKERYTFINILNNVHNLDDQREALNLIGDPLPDASDYTVLPPTKIDSATAGFIYGQDVAQGSDNGVGTVKYGLSDSQYCKINIDWQYNANALAGCKITADAVNNNIGPKDQKIICQCDQAPNSNICRNQRITDQQCSAEIDIALTSPVVPGNYNVSLQNIYYYNLKLNSYTPSDSSNYLVPPPQTIGASQTGTFIYKLAAEKNPSVVYALAGDPQNRNCQFNYSYDVTKNLCVASSQNTGSIHCNVCKATFDPQNESCNYLWSVGGDCVIDQEGDDDE